MEQHQPIDLDRESDVEQQNTQSVRDKRTADVWHKYVDIRDPETHKIVKAQCKICSRVLKVATKNGTSFMANHLLTCPNNPGNIDKKQKKINIFKTSQSDATTVSNWEFNQNSIRQSLAKMIVIDEEPFSYVERDGF
ncbi:unnamed protein product [Lactuca virosa]|uniref:BED-type domain-containing protein n=1 Tax=Lactuca virosa TaxID=75947 RepID=A0AAU9MSV8_9ASTR|nr:unnamed protein product [Lactuca virosa]CAH1429657.1 unnamed protein product [Lactuca virosa]